MSRLPTVIVPIHNALEALDACLASLDRTLPPGSPVLLADEALAAADSALSSHRAAAMQQGSSIAVKEWDRRALARILARDETFQIQFHR